MVMAKLTLLCFLSIICFASTTYAATYVVGDTSGWDISSDIDSWTSDKTFNVGDVLLFQYSSSHSVNEVTKDSFETCNTTDALRSFSNGNTTITLSNGGARYFVCGNKLHCLGGMKLKVNVEGNQTSSSTVGAPPRAQPDGSTLPRPSSKSDDPSTVIPTSTGRAGAGIEPFVCFTAALLLLVHNR